MIKFYFWKVGENLDDCFVLVCVLIGKVVYNVGGLTIYLAFNIFVD